MTAGVAAPAYAGIPVTHRDDASAVAFVTGHEDPDKDESSLDWDALAAFPGTLVLYMGVKRLPEIMERLIARARCHRAGGRRRARNDERSADGERLPRRAPGHGAERAATAGGRRGRRGRGARRRDRVAREPPAAPTTRGRHEGSRPGERARASLTALGAEVVEPPAIRIEPRIDSDTVRRAVDDIYSYALVCLTSPNGADLLFEAMAAAGRDARALANASSPRSARDRVGTAQPRRYRRRRPGAVGGRGASRRWPTSRSRDGRFSSRAAAHVTCSPTRCASAGPTSTWWRCTRRRGGARPGRARRRRRGGLRHLHLVVDGEQPRRGGRRPVPTRARIVSIGPITSSAAREAGLEVHVEAERHDIEGLVEALLADAASAR